jgi:hypothetical protein
MPSTKEIMINYSTAHWFKNYCNNALVTLRNLREERTNMEVQATFLRGNGKCKPEIKKAIQNVNIAINEIHYEQIRMVSELFYIIEQYIDGIFCSEDRAQGRASYMNLIKVIYRKSQILQREIGINIYEPKTAEQKGIFKTVISQLHATEKVVSKYLTKQELYFRPKRNIQRVNYKL